jgi:allantoate deiminase
VSAMSRPARFGIDADLVARCIEEMARYGAHPVSGMRRLVYRSAWRESVAPYVRWLEHEGLHVRQDAVGNVFGVAPGRELGLSIVTGSHIDTAVRDGKYDGTLGVIAAYVALRTLLRAVGQPRRPSRRWRSATRRPVAFTRTSGSRVPSRDSSSRTRPRQSSMPRA